MTLEEKYQYAVSALRNIFEDGREGTGAAYCFDDMEVSYYDGRDAGMNSMADIAEEALQRLGEEVKK